jgi:hypothetical protein
VLERHIGHENELLASANKLKLSERRLMQEQDRVTSRERELVKCEAEVIIFLFLERICFRP